MCFAWSTRRKRPSTCRCSIRRITSLIELEDRPLQWLRATCSDACLVTYRYLDAEIKEGGRAPAVFYLLRILTDRGATPGPGELAAGSHCTADDSAELRCTPPR